MALSDTRSNHRALRDAIHAFIKQKWDTSFSSRSQDHLKLWLSFVNFYVKQGGTPLPPYS